MKNPNEEIHRLREAFHQAILADLHEGVLSYHKIAVKHGTTVTLVYNLARANHCQRRAGKVQGSQGARMPNRHIDARVRRDGFSEKGL